MMSIADLKFMQAESNLNQTVKRTQILACTLYFF